MRSAFLIAALLAFMGATSVALADGTTPPAAQPQVKNIKKVDWKNFTYPGSGEKDAPHAKPITLKSGKGRGEEDLEDLGAKLMKVTYQDVTGDAAEEALVFIHWDHTERMSTDCFYLYTLKEGRPELVWKGFGGGARVSKRSLVVDRLDEKGRPVRDTYTGTPEGPLRLVKSEKPGAPQPKGKKGRP